MSANSWRPLSVKLKVTVGWSNWSKLGFGSLMSVPESAGRSRITNHSAPGSFGLSGAPTPFTPSFSTTIVPCGTAMTSVLGGCFWPGSSEKRSFCVSVGPAIQAWVCALKR